MREPQTDADLERQLEDGRVVDNMRRFGGGFVQALAAAWVRADLDNRARIKAAFPELWEKYSAKHW